MTEAFRVGKAVYRGPAVINTAFALLRPALEGGYCGFERRRIGWAEKSAFL